MTHMVFHKCLHRVDLGRHQIVHIHLISLIHEKHTDYGHAHKNEAGRDKEYRVYPGSEIIASEVAATSSTYKQQ